MVTQSVISFRKDYWMSNFPVEARFYQNKGIGGRCEHTSRTIHSAEDLRNFQEELDWRESSGEWMFVAYYETNEMM